jgi:hypothetical protein
MDEKLQSAVLGGWMAKKEQVNIFVHVMEEEVHGEIS